MATVRDRIKKFDRVKASAIAPNPKNWRTHGDAQRSALRAMLEEVGIADACIVRETGRGKYQLIDGHLRREELGDDAKIPVLILDVTAKEAEKLLATIDPLAAMAGTDKEKLAALAGAVRCKGEAAAALLANVVKRYTGDELTNGKTRVAFDANASSKVPAVVVLCDDDADQAATLAALQAEGYTAWAASVRPEKPVETKPAKKRAKRAG